MRGEPGLRRLTGLVWNSCSTAYCVTLGKLLNLSEHQLSGGDNKCIYYMALLGWLSETRLVEGGAWLTHGRCTL